VDAHAYLDSRARFGMKFGLETMRRLLAELGHPDGAFPVLLVAGTNGKGSVAAYLDSALRGSGLHAGRYTSPHLARVHERIVVGGRAIAEPALQRCVGAVRAAAARLVRRGAIPEHPTHFETLTAAALLHFRDRRVDVAVCEVGLGGRLDATNATEPLCSAVVSVDFDHEAQLGATLGAIAREKAGVLRARRVTVLGPLPDEARLAIAAEGDRVGARLREAWDGVVLREEKGGRVSLRTPAGRYARLRPLPGRFQRDNLVVAVRLLEAAAEAGLAVDFKAASVGFSRTRWPGRLQALPGRPPLLLDGAHNPAGARALAVELASGPPFVMVFGVMGDKDVARMASALFPPARALVLTRAPGERALAPDEIARRAGAAAAGALVEADIGRALRAARRLAKRGGRVVVAGSLFLVGEVLRRRAAISGSPARGRAAARSGRASTRRARRRGPGRRRSPSRPAR
jgi:dihydrofolate synthase/folylpolyglutamate synthase